MKNLKNIVAGVDYSEASEAALKEAWRIARWNDAELTVVHVVDRTALDGLADRVEVHEEEIRERAQGQLDAHVREVLGEEFKGTTSVTIGHPFADLLHVVKARAADLLVLGSQGSSRKENRTGILAARCVRKAPVRVLLVRQRQENPFRKVAACIDFSDNSRLAVEQAVSIARQDGAELHLFHVFQPVAPGLIDVAALAQPINPLLDDNYIEHLKEKMLGLLEPVKEEAADLEVKAHVIEEVGVGHGIVDALNEIGADLVVLGTRGRTGLKVLLMGTTAERVIHDAPCSVLAIKPEGFHYKID